jgi:hypothetical protein
LLAGAALLGGCGSTSTSTTPIHLRPDQRPTPIGRGAAYRLPAVSTAVSRRASIRGLTCSGIRPGPPRAAHLELYARRLVLPLPAGIGVAPPLQRHGENALGRLCTYPVRTYAPTGIVRFDRGHTLTLADLFAVWGQTLSRRQLAGFRGRVVAYLGGRRWAGPPQAIPLREHEEIVVEVGGFIPPHPSYSFPPGV